MCILTTACAGMVLLAEAKAEVVVAYAHAASAKRTEVTFEMVPIFSRWRLVFGAKAQFSLLYMAQAPTRRKSTVVASLEVLLYENESPLNNQGSLDIPRSHDMDSGSSRALGVSYKTGQLDHIATSLSMEGRVYCQVIGAWSPNQCT